MTLTSSACANAYGHSNPSRQVSISVFLFTGSDSQHMHYREKASIFLQTLNCMSIKCGIQAQEADATMNILHKKSGVHV
jgi:hypothetical protein